MGEESVDLTPALNNLITVVKSSPERKIPAKTREEALGLVHELYSLDLKIPVIERALDFLRMLLDGTSEMVEFVFGSKRLRESYS